MPQYLVAIHHRDDGTLMQVRPSSIVALNRAVAVGMAQGSAAGLQAVDRLSADPALAGYHLLPSVRGDFLTKRWVARSCWRGRCSFRPRRRSARRWRRCA